MEMTFFSLMFSFCYEKTFNVETNKPYCHIHERISHLHFF